MAVSICSIARLLQRKASVAIATSIIMRSVITRPRKKAGKPIRAGDVFDRFLFPSLFFPDDYESGKKVSTTGKICRLSQLAFSYFLKSRFKFRAFLLAIVSWLRKLAISFNACLCFISRSLARALYFKFRFIRQFLYLCLYVVKHVSCHSSFFFQRGDGFFCFISLGFQS